MNVQVRRLASITLGATMIVLVAAGVAAATGAVFGAGGTLYACAKKNEGLLRLVENSADCTEAEQPVQWNVQGPPGAQGPPGPPGPGLQSLEDLESKPCRIDNRSGTVAFTRFVPPLGAFALVGFYCMTADRFEPNDTRVTAADITAEIAPSGLITLTGLTIHSAGDEDWFLVRGATFKRVNLQDFGLVVDVYRDGQLVVDDLRGAGVIDDGAAAHDWEFHIRSTGGATPIIGNLSPF